MIVKVFISHSSKDKRFVRKLKNDLEENGISTWIDEDEIDAGDSLLDKLEDGLEESTHFIIVLSQNSVKSQWVRHELENAIKGNHKIIPIKYKECNIPIELEGLLYIDLSNEIVECKGELIDFITNGYQKNLSSLVRAIKAKKYKLTSKDKSEIKSKLEQQKTGKDNNYVRIYVKVIGYTPSGIKRFKKILQDKGVENPAPVLLPPIAKIMNFNEGDVVNIKFGENHSVKAHFAKFRKDDLKIVLPVTLRKQLGIQNLSIYAFEFNTSDKTITVLTE